MTVSDIFPVISWDINGWRLVLLVGNAVLIAAAILIRVQVRAFRLALDARHDRLAESVGRVVAHCNEMIGHVRNINGRLGRLEQWSDDHEKADDQMRVQLDRLRDRLNNH